MRDRRREAASRPGAPPNLVAASDRIRSELGWSAGRSELTRMIVDAWAFAQAHRDGYPD